MNLLHMKYAVEVAEAGSINKAAERLNLNQPNLSRAVKELEGTLGITLFLRSPRGMVPTPDGERFLAQARQILQQISQIESEFQGQTVSKQRFSISVPRASYISDAFAAFSLRIGDGPAELFYQETNSLRAIENILHSDYKLGVIRYAAAYSKYFKSLLEEKELAYQRVAEFRYVLIMSRAHPLAAKEQIGLQDLQPFVEIAHADPYVPSLPLAEVRRSELPDDVRRRIFVFERGGQFSLLAKNPQTYMWVSPIPEEMLNQFGLVQRECVENRKRYCDTLIYRRGYQLSKLDRCFIEELSRAKRQHLDGYIKQHHTGM